MQLEGFSMLEYSTKQYLMTYILLEYSTLFDMENAVDRNNGIAAAVPPYTVGKSRYSKTDLFKSAAIQCNLIPSANKSLPILGKKYSLR